MASTTSVEQTKVSRSILRTNTKGDMKSTALKTLAYTGIGVIGGGLAGAVLGKPSFFLGAVLTGVGFYKDITWLAPLGLGMMASSHITSGSTNTVEGFSVKQETENIKARLVDFKDGLFSKTYMDKVFKKKTPETKTPGDAITVDKGTTSGFGSVEDNIKTLDNMEQQLVASAMEHQIRNAGEPSATQVNGVEDEPDFSGM